MGLLTLKCFIAGVIFLYAYVYACMWTHISVQVHMQHFCVHAQDDVTMSGVFLNHLPPYFSQTGHLLNLELIGSAKTSQPISSRDPPIVSSPVLVGYRHMLPCPVFMGVQTLQ